MKDETREGYSRRWIALAFLSLSLLIISLDNTVLNVALPSIAEDLGASTGQQQWIVDSYVLVFAALLLTMGAIGDRMGRKRLLQHGLFVFGVCSMWAAMSDSTGMLITARAFLGIGAAIIMPSTLSIVTATFPEPKERAQAIAIWAGVFGLGVGLGPVIAGWLLEHWAWHSVFVVNLPVVVVGLTGNYFFVGESRDEKITGLDIPGVILSVTGLLALVYGIIEAGGESWTEDDVILALIIAVVLLGVFGWWERYTPNPMLPLAFFRNMSFSAASIAILLALFSMFGAFFFMSQYFQSVQGHSPLDTGLRILPMAIVLMIATVNSARVSRHLGIKLTVAIGIFIAGIGLVYFWLVAQVDTEYWVALIGMCLVATGIGTAMSPATDSIMGSIPLRKAGIASAMNDATRQVGGALGVAVLGTIMNTAYMNKTDILSQSLTPDDFEAIQSSIQQAHIVADGASNPAIAQRIVDTANEAFVSGMTDAFLVGAIVMVVTSLITLAILPTRIIPPRDD